MVCRDAARAEVARARVAEVATAAPPVFVLLDLADLATVRAAASDVARRFPRIDVLLNNAGIMAVPFARTAQGFEIQFGVNHLGHFVWTMGLAALLTDRVVNVTSDVIRLWGFDFSDPNFERRRYSRWIAYVQSKAANVLFTRGLARRLPPGLRAMSAHPGYTSTDLQQRTGSAIEGLGMSVFGAIVRRSPEEGVRPILRACTDPDARSGDHYGVGGLLAFGRREPVREQLPERLRDDAEAERLWATSVALTGVDLPAR
jgi:NAD(P)-dependent dehydrogenase (short-subunit alcohol dehydrogenase family)